MPVLELDGRQLEVDGDGFLANPEVWDAGVAQSIAQYDGIEELTDKHWSVITIIRTNYEEKGMAPMIRTICKESGLRLREIYELFPLGPARGACRVAGLPKTVVCGYNPGQLWIGIIGWQSRRCCSALQAFRSICCGCGGWATTTTSPRPPENHRLPCRMPLWAP